MRSEPWPVLLPAACCGCGEPEAPWTAEEPFAPGEALTLNGFATRMTAAAKTTRAARAKTERSDNLLWSLVGRGILNRCSWRPLGEGANMKVTCQRHVSQKTRCAHREPNLTGQSDCAGPEGFEPSVSS